jgi:membrane-bound lytic murein transglycosylase
MSVIPNNTYVYDRNREHNNSPKGSQTIPLSDPVSINLKEM